MEIKNDLKTLFTKKQSPALLNNINKWTKEIKYDFEKIHQILEPLGKWEKVLEISHQKLQDVLKEIPLASRQEIDKAKIIEKEYKYFTGNNKIPED